MLTSNTVLPSTYPKLLTSDIETIPFQSKKVVDRLDISQSNLAIRSNSDPNAIIDRLKIGNQQFIERLETHNSCHHQSICLSAVAQGRIPAIAVLNHAKLTTSIEEIFGQKFGELFTIDALQSLATDLELSAIEYTVIVSGIKVLVVLADRAPQPMRGRSSGDLGIYEDRHKYFKLAIKPNRYLIFDLSAITTERIELQMQPDLWLQIENLKTSPLISRSIAAGNLQIIGGLYDRERGTVTFVKPIASIHN
jgi:carbonic anhydrase